MPTTPNGTAYTVHRATLPTHGVVNVGVADAALPTADVPTILYTHGAGGSHDQFATLGAWAGLREWLIDHGWAWVEGAGGGLQPWGNPASEAAYIAALEHADTILDVGPVVILGRSMGGAVAARLYTTSPIAPRCAGLIQNSGVQDLIWAYDSARWTAAFHTAWGVTDRAGLVAAVDGYNPADLPAAAWGDTSVIQLVGSADTTVPPGPNAYAMRDLYTGRPVLDVLDVRPGGDHSAGNGSYLQVAPMVAFLEQVTGGTPEPTARILRRTGTWLLTGGGRHPVTLTP